MPNVLGYERNSVYLTLLKDALSLEHRVCICSSMAELMQKLGKNVFDIGILDVDAHEDKALTILKILVGHLGSAPVIVTSQRQDVQWIVEVVRAGAYDFITKPYTPEEIRLAVKRSVEKISMKNEIDYLRRQQNVLYDMDLIVAKSPVMRTVMEWARKYAFIDSNLLITGETGTGKSFLAGAIHFNSPRKKKPFIKINCANIPETLLESELFGHEKGAFTNASQARVGRMEQAGGGTVFLDEIGEMSAALQAKLLQVVDEKSFQRLGDNRTIHSDIRIIVSTNRNLAQMVEVGEFRSDLYYRLNVINLHLPSLRERKECIEPLSRMFLARLGRQLHRKIDDISLQALNMLTSHSWPGNIRELANVIERAILLENTRVLKKENIHLACPTVRPKPNVKPPVSRVQNLHASERKAIIRALEDNLWVQRAAAGQLGISPRSLNYRIKKLGITHWRWHRNRSN